MHFETTYQQIYYDHSATEEEFLHELCQAAILQDCLDLPKNQALATPGLKFRKIYDNALGRYAYQFLEYEGDATEIIIPAKYEGLSVILIDDDAFRKCSSLTSVTFDGTKAEWNNISKGFSFSDGACIHCTDGDISG